MELRCMTLSIILVLLIGAKVIGRVHRTFSRNKNYSIAWYYGIGFSIIAILLLALTLGACASGNPEPRVPELSIPFDTAYWKNWQNLGGMTYCDRSDQPYILYNGTLNDSVYHTVRVHEMKHVAQVKEARTKGIYGFKGGCRKFMALQSDSTDEGREFRFQVESHAYCAQVDSLHDDIDKLAGRIRATRILVANYDLHMKESYIREHLPC